MFQLLQLGYLCAGVLKESRKWVGSVRANEPLKKAFLDYIKPPNSNKKLRTLSDYVSILTWPSTQAARGEEGKCFSLPFRGQDTRLTQTILHGLMGLHFWGDKGTISDPFLLCYKIHLWAM